MTAVAAQKLMIQFTCPRCGRELAWAYENASVYCRACDRWVLARQMREINPAKADPERNQLQLF